MLYATLESHRLHTDFNDLKYDGLESSSDLCKQHGVAQNGLNDPVMLVGGSHI